MRFLCLFSIFDDLKVWRLPRLSYERIKSHCLNSHSVCVFPVYLLCVQTSGLLTKDVMFIKPLTAGNQKKRHKTFIKGSLWTEGTVKELYYKVKSDLNKYMERRLVKIKEKNHGIFNTAQ